MRARPGIGTYSSYHAITPSFYSSFDILSTQLQSFSSFSPLRRLSCMTVALRIWWEFHVDVFSRNDSTESSSLNVSYRTVSGLVRIQYLNQARLLGKESKTEPDSDRTVSDQVINPLHIRAQKNMIPHLWRGFCLQPYIPPIHKLNSFVFWFLCLI